jgi:hypothetical protein
MSLIIPEASRPVMKNYGISDKFEGLIEWEWVREQMTNNRNYWVCSSRPDGRPHAAPVWGGVVDDIIYFGSASSSVKSRNIAERPDVVVHLDNGDDVVIIEGRAELIQDMAIAQQLSLIYAARYPYKPSAEDLISGGLYGVYPELVIAWKETDFRKTATRWEFGK